jgi:hypothetical protein
VSGGCRLLSHRDGSLLAQAASRLRWELLTEAEGVYQVSIHNPGRTTVSLAGLELQLVAGVTSLDEHPVAGPETGLPASVPGRDTLSVPVVLPTGPTWPDEFVVTLFLKEAGSGETLTVTEKIFRPGNFGLTAVRPASGEVDFPVWGAIEFGFAVPVSTASLIANMTLEPAAPLEVRALQVQAGEGPGEGPSGESQASTDGGVLFEVRAVGGLAPFTRYRLTVGSDLETVDGLVRMGRPRGVIFSTGPASLDQWAWAPSWSPDGLKVAWTAPGAAGLADLYIGDVGSMTAGMRVSRVAGGTPAWGAGGDRLYYAVPERDGLAVASLDLSTGQTGVLIEASDLQACSGIRLSISPSGKHLAIEVNLGAIDSHSDVCQLIYTYNFETGVLARLPADGLTAILAGWLGGKLLYASTHEGYDHSHSFRYDLHLYDLARARKETLLSGGLLRNVGGFSVAASAPLGGYWTWEAWSDDRRIVHRPAGLWLLGGLDRNPVPGPVALPAAGTSYRQVAFSPDGTMAAAAGVFADASWDLVLFSLHRVSTGITSDEEATVAWGPRAQFAPAWSPDGSRLAFIEAQGSSVRVLVMSPTNREATEFTITRP